VSQTDETTGKIVGEQAQTPPEGDRKLRRLELIWGSLALRSRFIFIVMILLATMMAGVLSVLFGTGAIEVGTEQAQTYISRELDEASKHISRDYGSLSAGGVQLSKDLAFQIEETLSRQGLTLADLQKDPKGLNQVLRECFDTVLTALSINQASAAYLILDATVNPALSNAQWSRAGLFLRNTEPNAANRAEPSISLMRGPVDLARPRDILMLPQWELEFKMTPGDFFYQLFEDSQKTQDVSRLYWWNPRTRLPRDNVDGMLVAVPIVASDGTVLGVCGLEVNAMLFKLLYTPENDSRFPGAVVLLSPERADGVIDMGRSLMASSRALNHQDAELVPDYSDGFASRNGQVSFIGHTKQVGLYPRDSIHEEANWQVSVLMSAQEVAESASNQGQITVLLLVGVMIVGVIAGNIAIIQLLRPLNRAIEEAKTGSFVHRTNIREIDDLFAFLAAQDAAQAKQRAPGLPTNVISDDEFSRRLEALTPAETAVFNLYVEGYDAAEVSAMLFLSKNTIKTHNRHIYNKLGVASRRELMAHLRSLNVSTPNEPT
jgi:DNA-binding CsgD family transcriptional regulator